MSFSNLNQEDLEIVVQNDQISISSESNQSLGEELSNSSETSKEFSSSSSENKPKEATENSNLELNYIFNESVETEVVGYQKVSQVDPDSDQNETFISYEKTFNFICIDNYQDYPEIYAGRKEHFLMTIAKSGQPKLIRHKLILRLVEKKWRFIPRTVYHVQTLMHFSFLVYTLNEFHIYNLAQLEKQKETLTNNSFNSSENIFNSTNVPFDLGEKDGRKTNLLSLIICFILLVYFLLL
jgi:hypothetical protein